YSFGVVMFNLLTNGDPFAGSTPREIISAQLFQPPRRFEEVAPDVHVPEAIQRVVYRALEKDPDQRYADATEFMEAVEQAFDIHDARPVRLTRPASTESDEVVPIDRTQVATTVVPVARTEVVAERRPRGWRWAAVAALVVVIAAAGVMMWQRAEAAKLAAY